MSFVNEKLEEMKSYLKNKNVAVIGIGVSNIPLIRYLAKLGSKIVAFDKRRFDQIEESIILELSALGVELSLGEKYLNSLIGFDIIFRSPSVRPDLPELIKEQGRGAILTSEIELVMELCPGKIIAVTGSDGKTTTTTLIYEILKNKYNCYIGGNIGTPLFDKLDEMLPEDIIVLELSSFQLMTMTTSPQIAVITNISENHLDIHTDYDEYINAKKNIFKHQSEDDLLILNYDNEITKMFSEYAKSKVTFFSSKQRLDYGIILDDGIIKSCENKLRKHILNTKNIFLRGTHNFENICAAVAATKDLVDVETIIKAISSFKGVEHRMELIRTLNEVEYYNDSIGTSPTRTIAGLNSFDEKVILIAGGYDKHLDYTPIGKPIVEKVKALITLGQTKDKIIEAVQNELEKQHKELDIYECETLEQAVLIANKIARQNDKVILSPASASFDLYKNFAERGEHFKKLIEELKN